MAKEVGSDALAWTLALAAVLGAQAGLTELVQALRAGVGARLALTALVGGAGFALVAALVIAPLAFFAVRGSQRLEARLGRPQLWALGLLVAGVASAWLITAPAQIKHQSQRWALVLCFGASLVVAAAWALRAGRRGRLLALAGGALAAAAELVPPRELYPEVHDLVAFVAGMALFAAATGWRRRLRERPARRLAPALLAVGVAAALAITLQPALSPAWRVAAERHGSWTPRLLRTVRAVVDLDGDGFSAIAWGLDCDDRDPRVNPLATELAGEGDRNCNGSITPAAPSDEQRGLAPPFGEPEARAGEIERVVLITIDAWRADAFHPETMPELAAFAAGGVRMSRAYAGSTRTNISLSYLMRFDPEQPSLAAALGARGVDTWAEIATEPFAFEAVVEDFATWKARSSSTRGLIDRAIAAIAAQPARPGFFWLHLIEPHAPYHERPEIGPGPRRGFSGDRGRYLAEVAAVDRELGRLFRALQADPRWPRTLVIVTGDHGEAFGEHGMRYHTVSTWEPVVRVPLVVVGAGMPAMEYQELVSHADVPATVLGAFGLLGAPPDGFPGERVGRSLLRLRGGSGPLHQFVVVRSAKRTSAFTLRAPLLALVEGNLKLTVSLEDGLASLYDVVADPGELHDLSLERPDEVARLRKKLAVYQDITSVLLAAVTQERWAPP